MMISNGYFEFIYSDRNERAYEIYKQSLIERVFSVYEARIVVYYYL